MCHLRTGYPGTWLWHTGGDEIARSMLLGCGQALKLLDAVLDVLAFSDVSIVFTRCKWGLCYTVSSLRITVLNSFS